MARLACLGASAAYYIRGPRQINLTNISTQRVMIWQPWIKFRLISNIVQILICDPISQLRESDLFIGLGTKPKN
jgi:hypothetical protein